MAPGAVNRSLELNPGFQPNTAVFPLRSHHYARAAEMLAAAFETDPLLAAVLPGLNSRCSKLQWMFAKILGWASKHGEIHTTAALEGVSCWLPPGRTSLSFWNVIQSGLAAIPFRLGGAAAFRLHCNQAFTDRAHVELMPAPHFYLWVLGVDPVHQRKGIGRRLIKFQIANAEQLGLPCYLETHAKSNVEFYSSLGFKVLREVFVPQLNLHFWAMGRNAKTATTLAKSEPKIFKISTN